VGEGEHDDLSAAKRVHAYRFATASSRPPKVGTSVARTVGNEAGIVALFWFQTTSISRGQGRSALAAAAYRAGDRLRDEGRNVLYNYSSRRDIVHREILLPAARADDAPDWARNRSELWNAAERSERRSDARVAREFAVTLPPELDHDRRTALALSFAQHVADRYGTVVDLASHLPRPEGDPRNFHAHLLTTTRELTPGGLGRKSSIELSDSGRAERGLPRVADELRLLRADWAERTNEALRAAGLEITVDHRTLKAQGIDRIPKPSVPMAVVQMERRGIATEVMRSLRASHPYYVQAQAKEQVVRGDALGIDERAALARERWQAYRAALDDPMRAREARRELEKSSAAARERARDFGAEFGD
jgi:MobA/MobL family